MPLISLQYIIDIDINNHMNIEIVHSNNTMITKLQNSLSKYTNSKQWNYTLLLITSIIL